MKKRPNILTIAGFDPSGGAGILADIKTFEQFKCNGYAVQTANTIQTETEFDKANWIDENVIFEQLNKILKNREFEFLKIGLIPNIEFLHKLCNLKTLSETKKIWDPILATSTGVSFNHDLEGLKETIKDIYLVTPNWDEVVELSGTNEAEQGARELSNLTKVYLKGGHNEKALGKDYLFENGSVRSFNPVKGKYFTKHGSGCVFSSALTANLARKYPITKAILRSKRYVERFLSSSETKLGFHNY